MRFTRNFLVIIGGLLIIFFTLYFWSCPSKSNNDFLATPQNPVISSSGKYQLQVVEGNNGKFHFWRFYIADVKNLGKSFEPEVIYSSQDTFATRFSTFILWDDDNDTVWVYYSDTGTYYWEQNNKGQWEKNIYLKDEHKIKAPKKLKKLLPNFF